MSYIFTKLNEVGIIDSLNNASSIFAEKSGEIKRASSNLISYGNGKITDYGYLGRSKNKPYEDENGSSWYYYAFFDLEGNEVDNIEVVKAFNKGVVRYTNPSWSNGREIAFKYYVKDGKLYIPDKYNYQLCLGDINISNDEIYILPEPDDYFYSTNDE